MGNLIPCKHGECIHTLLMVIYHPLYGMNYYVLIWGDKETLVLHLVATLIYLSQNYSYYIRGDRSPLKVGMLCLLYTFAAGTVYIYGFNNVLDQ